MNIPENLSLTSVDAIHDHSDLAELTSDLTPRQQFDTQFEAMAALGKCDSLGGMEYSRKLKAWERLGSSDVTMINAFILDQY